MFEGVKGQRLLKVAIISAALVGTTVPPVYAQGSFFVSLQASRLERQVARNPARAATRIDRMYTRNPTRAVEIVGAMDLASANALLAALYAQNPDAARDLSQDLIDAGHPVSPFK